MTRRATWTVIASAATGLMLLPTVVASPPALLWNATASTPVGLYRVRPAGALRIGQLVVAMPPEPLASFLAARDYLPERVPLLKHVAALAGQQVCRIGVTVTIDGVIAGIALIHDSRDRPLPAWNGCRTITEGQVFLMNRSVPDSLDGRYFGPLPAASIVGSAVSIWTRKTKAAQPAWRPATYRQFHHHQQGGLDHGTDWNFYTHRRWLFGWSADGHTRHRADPRAEQQFRRRQCAGLPDSPRER